MRFDQHNPPPGYERPALYAEMAEERDLAVPMRDGVTLCVDVYRPAAAGRFPALVSLASHNKEFNSPEFAQAAHNAQPAWSRMWMGGAEAGDSLYFALRGYVHVVGNTRGSGKSQGGGSPAWDAYDLVEWAAAQPWCDGNVGMVGLSAFAGAQFDAAALAAPHLKAIFPYGAGSRYRLREMFPGGVLHPFTYLLDALSVVHGARAAPGELPPALEAKWREAMANPDYRMYPNIYNILTMKGQIYPALFQALVEPFEDEEAAAAAETALASVRVPVYTGVSFSAYTYKRQMLGCLRAWEKVRGPKKLMLSGVAQIERPFHSFHDEMLRWFDHWLHGTATGVMDEPPVKVWVAGENRWRAAHDWPLPQTRWTKLHLHSWGRLRAAPFVPGAREDAPEPDGFLQMPPTQTDRVQKLRYMTEPLERDLAVIGPIELVLYAAIDQPDTNWIAILKDVGPDGSVRSAREGEMGEPQGLPEREVSRGWLKASHRALDASRSKPGQPWHPFTRAAWKPVVPGEICEYAIEIMPAANLFRRGHRVCVEIASLDLPAGPAGLTSVEYVPYHICSSRTVAHRVYRDARHPSHLLLPVIPED
ncbi:MAG: CocE/NonD family hydrolase [Burkholderiales bacterium]|nr:CocE/NonD family hydrolase [Burkholderiales bacterium]